jgi:hypothetical protein
MKYRSSILPVTVAVALFASSCTHYYYAPSSNNIPLLTEKNDGNIELKYSVGNYYEGVEVQSAYAVGKHVGVQLNFFTASESEDDYGSGNGSYIEAAGGYFQPTTNHKWVFETYAGIGTGVVNNKYGSAATSKVGLTKFFIQPSFGFTNPYFDIAIASKFSLANFKVKNSTVNKDAFPIDYYDIQLLEDTKSFFIWEPGIMMRGGFKGLKFQGNLTVAVPSNSSLSLDNVNFSTGIMIPFKPKKQSQVVSTK